MSEQPQTEAGRALLEREAPPPPDHADPSEEWVADAWAFRNAMEGRILAIEREAVAAYLASPQAAEELARAGLEHKYAMNERGVIHRCRWRRNSDCAEAILAALRDQRGAS